MPGPRLRLPILLSTLGVLANENSEAWWTSLSTAAAARAQYGDLEARASACEDASVRQRAWRAAYAHAQWLPDASNLTACEPRGAACVEAVS